LVWLTIHTTPQKIKGQKAKGKRSALYFFFYSALKSALDIFYFCFEKTAQPSEWTFAVCPLPFAF
jgi:hypothetical protein